MITPMQMTYYMLSSDDLDELVQVHFKKPGFESIAEYEWSDSECHTGTVFMKEIDEAEHPFNYEMVQDFIHALSKYTVHWSYLLAELARRGEVPEGNYLIYVQ